jgi:hypothetical protein
MQIADICPPSGCSTFKKRLADLNADVQLTFLHLSFFFHRVLLPWCCALLKKTIEIRYHFSVVMVQAHAVSKHLDIMSMNSAGARKTTQK